MPLLLAALPFAFFPKAEAQPQPPQGLYIILDASGSMEALLTPSANRMAEAKRVLQDFLAGDFPDRELALRVYGHRRKGDCADSELMIPFASPDQIKAKIGSIVPRIKPLGKTPITFSLQEALKDFGSRAGEIVLISDGIETCDADPCALMREWKSKDVKIKVNVVGFGLDEKSKETLKCISDVSGTPYYDAQNAATLTDSLKQIRQKVVQPGVYLEGRDASGQPLRVQGHLSQNGKTFELVSGERAIVPPGAYELTGGVLTRNGRLYRPVTQSVQVATDKDTLLSITVPVPPSVRAQFLDQDKPQEGNLITAAQSGREVFRFRWFDEVYLDEGAYEFRAKPRGQQELTVNETFAAGDRKELKFEMERAVLVKVRPLPTGATTPLSKNIELWQNGQKVAFAHVANGGIVKPGVYDLVLVDELFGHTQKGITIGDQGDQTIVMPIPAGHVTVVYLDAAGKREPEKRCFIGRGEKTRGLFRASGEKHPLAPGTYNVTGWGGEYDPVVFTIKEGEQKQVELRRK